jgi:flagellar biosynthetic protein FlhB
MAEENDQEKTEEATQTRREDFRKKGQVAQSKELASALFILAAALGVLVLGRFFFSQIYELFNFSFGPDLVLAVRSGDLIPALMISGEKFLLLVAPVLGISLIIGLASSVLQVGFLQVEDALTPDINKINFIEGFKRIFSMRALAEGIKAILKMIFVGVVVYLILRNQVSVVPFLVQKSVSEIAVYLGTMTGKLLFGVGLAMLVLAAADYFFQRWDLEKKMMMTKQEVKEEHKSREGDPLIKARVRKIQRELSNRRMMEKVPTADVIITNPTHIAVALKYDQGLPAPQLVAKGADLIAERIKSLARQHDIPIVENIPLARTIYKTMKLGQVIPRELFVAVAEVLSYVYKIKKKKVRKS